MGEHFLVFIPGWGEEEVTFLWMPPLQLLSLALATPQYKLNYVPSQGMGSGKGSRREGLCPVLFRQLILKYMGALCWWNHWGFHIEKTMDIDPGSCGWACYKTNMAWIENRTPVLLWHHLFLLFNYVLIHHCHLPSFFHYSQHPCPGFVRHWHLKIQFPWIL